MHAQQFLAVFGHVANAPEGVARLRSLVLSLAFCGRLCTASSDSVESLIDDLEDQRAVARVGPRNQRLAQQHAHRRKEEGPFAIPENWRWISLSALGHTWGQKKPSEDFYYIDVASIDNKAGALSSQLDIVAESAAPSRARKIVNKGTLIYSTIRPYLLNVAVVDRDFDRELIASTAFAVVHPWRGIEARYLFYYLRSSYFVRYVESVQIGVAYPAISDRKFYSGLVPIPPTEEQSRIVAKVDELMVLCDQLEKQQQARRKLQNALRRSTLQSLASAPGSHELQLRWQRLQANFGRLFSEPEDVRDFKNLVLELGVNGRLLGPSRVLADAAELLKQIAIARSNWAETAEQQEKKEAIAMAKKLRTQLTTAPATLLPSNWCWASLLHIAQVIIDCDHKTPIYSSDGIHLVRTTDIRDGQMHLHATKKVSEEIYQQRSRRLVPKAGDIFFTREAPMGEAAMVPRGKRVGLGQRLMLIRLFCDLFNPQYLLYVMQSPSFKGRLVETAVGMTVKHINVSDVEDLQIPVPPKDQQDRIVEILDHLFRQCALYTGALTQARKTAEQLATSAVAGLSGITVENDEDTVMKAPQTEIIAPLRLATPPDVKARAPLATILVRHEGEMAARDLWQSFGGEIDAFYAQLKTEVLHGWIAEPELAQVREKAAAETSKS
jgi:type I restriction enzyme, S subunit